jgi:hypothetical protein
MSIIDNYVSLNIQPAIGLLSTEDDVSTITTIPIRVLKQTAKNICRGGSDALTKHPSIFVF